MVEIINPDGAFPCLLVCDHASAHIPAEHRALGLSQGWESQHIAVDVGIEPVVRHLSSLLDAPAVLASHSRLLLDTNRWIADAQSIPEVSDGVAIPGNRDLSEAGRRERQDRYFWPFHEAVAEQVAQLRVRHGAAAFFALHSCTRQLALGATRTMDGGTIWHESSRFGRDVAESLNNAFGLTIADNEPYSGIGGGAFTIDYHTWGTGIAACGFEIVNDLILTDELQRKWAHHLASALESAITGERKMGRSKGDSSATGSMIEAKHLL